jgi:hypothetical protein
MFEAAQRDADTPLWRAAALEQPVAWDQIFGDYIATVDWPACSFWRELYTLNPDAHVLLSQRESADVWWESMAKTIVPRIEQPAEEPQTARRREMIRTLLERRFTPSWHEREAAIEAYERHNEQVRAGVPSGRLIEWQPRDGWGPICAALALPVPDEPFPHVNTAKEFRARNSDAGVSGASGS